MSLFEEPKKRVINYYCIHCHRKMLYKSPNRVCYDCEAKQ